MQRQQNLNEINAQLLLPIIPRRKQRSRSVAKRHHSQSSWFMFNHNENVFLDLTAHINDAEQTGVPTFLQPHLLYYLQFLRLMWHLGEKQMCDSTGREFIRHIWQIIIIQRWRTVPKAPAAIQPVTNDAPYNCFDQVDHRNLSQWTAWDHSWRAHTESSSYWSGRIDIQNLQEQYPHLWRLHCTLCHYSSTIV